MSTMSIESEITSAAAIVIFKNWIERMHKMSPEMTLDDYHQIMNADPEVFIELKKNIGWGDSFMIEQTNPTRFRIGGKYRLIDYPEIQVPSDEYCDQAVNINGVYHVVTNYGFLTFDAYPVEELAYDNEDETAGQSPRPSE